MDANGQSSASQQGINGLQFNAVSNQKNKQKNRNMEKNDEKPLLGNYPKPPLILPKRLNTIKSQNSNESNGGTNFENRPVDNDNNDPGYETNSPNSSRAQSAAFPDDTRLSRISRLGLEMPNLNVNTSQIRQQNSMRSPKFGVPDTTPPSSSSATYSGRPGSDAGSHISKPHSDAASVRSWASVGMGSTDGKKMIIRRVPTSPVELFNIVNPPTPPDDYLFEADSYDGATDDGDSIYNKPRRQHWSNKLQFVLACVGYSVGLGSVWRFPYLCYKSGGAVFLIPYAIIMVICGLPMLYLELAVGQYTGRGPIGALGHLCPLLKGTGLGSVVISFLMSTYYAVIIAYGIYYFFTSFKISQPWEDCSNRWNTPDCWVPANLEANLTRPPHSRTPSEEFYNEKVLQISKGIEELGAVRWELVVCLFSAWVLVYFSIWKSIKSSAKARYFTTTLPFILIIIFMAKSLTLEGAEKGTKYFFKPKFELLLDEKVWVNAASQTFNSLGIAFGSMISFSSYNKFNNNILYDTLAVWILTGLTSLLVGIYSFSIIGNIATELNASIEDVIADGPGLIFVIYPQAMAKMPANQFWCALFFFMLVCLALNSQFATVEVVVTSIQDGFPIWIKKNLLCHEMLVFVICIVSFMFGWPNVTKGGIYFFQLMDHYAAHISIMYLGFFEVVAVVWIYGPKRLGNNINAMTGKKPGIYFYFCWIVAAPGTMICIWVFCLYDYEAPSYNNGEYVYPTGAVIFGWIVSSLSLLCIPIFMIYVFIKTPGDSLWEKLKNSVKSDLVCPNCGAMECDCTSMKDEESHQPMMLLQGPDLKSGNLVVPYYNLPTTNPDDKRTEREQNADDNENDNQQSTNTTTNGTK